MLVIGWDPMVVASPDDLVSAVARDRRMVGYRLRRQGEGWIELDVPALKGRTGGDVMLVLAWPEVWRDKAALDAHFSSPHIAKWRSSWPALGIGERNLVLYEAGEPMPS